VTAPPAEGGHDDFPRRQARTRGFSLGTPRGMRIAPDGRRVAFLRSNGPEDPVNRLWALELPAGTERCVADPLAVGADPAALPPEEAARRERSREVAGGIVSYATDRALRRAAFALGGDLWVAELDDPSARRLAVAGPVVDPRPDPGGARVAYVAAGALHIVALDGGDATRLAGEDDPAVTWGLAEFIAAEEMGRARGFWWAPDGRRLLAARVDTTAVSRWHLADPADPARPPTALPYPAAGTANAAVSAALVDLEGRRLDVRWDREAFPYLARAGWPEPGPYLVVQSRDQRRLLVLAVDHSTGATTVVQEQHAADWVELVPGLPRRVRAGVLHTVDDGDTRRLALDGAPLTPPGMQVRGLVDLDGDAALVTASGEDPTAVATWRVPFGAGADRSTDAEPLTPLDGVATAWRSGGVTVVAQRDLERVGTAVLVSHPAGRVELASHAAASGLAPAPLLQVLGTRRLHSALLLPRGRGVGPFPVLLDPYGGPGAQRVLRSRGAFTLPQWFADAGFAVLVTDGRGSPGRGPAWERAIAGDLGSAPLEDQVDALHAAAEAHPGMLDLGRVAIRGWSFGGYLAARALLRRPDVFRAAIAGAPVVDWRLYDTHYTERYLGMPQDNAAAYDRSSLLADAGALDGALLLIHGLADDNVVAAHTLRLSAALLAAGRAHQVLPLAGVTHVTRQAETAAGLLRLQLAFLRAHLA
jgi:dipeptidyl-peptidase 4